MPLFKCTFIQLSLAEISVCPVVEANSLAPNDAKLTFQNSKKDIHDQLFI